jgi:predicted dienelactone hydrolase
MAGARFDISGEVKNIGSPTLVIHGSEDRYVPVANATALAESIPGARLRILEDAGHLVFIERSKEVNKEIVSFLKPRRKPRKKQEPQRQPATRKAKQLFGRAKKLNRELFLKPRRGPRKTKKGFTFGKLKGRFRRSSRVTGDWSKKLRGWLSR